MAPRIQDAVEMPPSSSDAALPSSQLSYRTAKSTGSSPIPPTTDAPQAYYRATKPLPYELQEHCAIHFEEGLYCQALNLLTSLVTASTATLNPRPALIPPTHFLRLISTLTVHPTLTTRAKSNDRLQTSILAHRYLRLVLRHTGPIHSGMLEAFKYDGAGSRPTGKKRTKSVSPEKENSNRIENELANTASLFSQAESFWQVVGWIFNCSANHQPRWTRWQSWLEFMLEVLEVDWAIHERSDTLSESILTHYILTGGGPTDSGRRILRAIFADGTGTSTGEFPSIWPHETASLQKNNDTAIKKAEKAIDIEADDYGDYHSSDSSSSTSNPPPTQSRPTPPSNTTTPPLGSPHVLHLRLRLLTLLLNAARLHPPTFSYTSNTTSSIEPLLTHLPAYLLPFPPPMLLSLLPPPLPPATASVLLQFLLHRTNLLEPAAPEPLSYELTQQTLEGSYLPWAAGRGGVADQARVAVLVEGLVRLQERFGGGLDVTAGGVEGCVERGIKRREERAGEGGRRRGRKRGKSCGEGEGEEEAWGWLRESGVRLRGYVGMEGGEGSR